MALARSLWLGSSDEPRSSVEAAVMGRNQASSIEWIPARRSGPDWGGT
jgi:hypothetical protein